MLLAPVIKLNAINWAEIRFESPVALQTELNCFEAKGLRSVGGHQPESSFLSLYNLMHFIPSHTSCLNAFPRLNFAWLA